MGEDEKLSRG